MPAESQSVGAGIYILLAIWTLSFLLCVFTVQTNRFLDSIALTVASFVTFILVVVPRDSRDRDQVDTVYDKFFILRYCTLIFVSLCFMGGFGYYLVYSLCAPVQTKKLGHWTQLKTA